MKRTIHKKKESGAEGRKRRKQKAKEAEKLKKFFVGYLSLRDVLLLTPLIIQSQKCKVINLSKNLKKVGQSKQESEEIGQSEKEIEKF